MTSKYILVLHAGHSGGKIESMARMVGEGVNGVEGMGVRIRTVPMLDADPKSVTEGDILATLEDFEYASGIILGSPTRFGNMSASLKNFIDNTGAIWMRHSLVGKPCGFFTSSASIHGGQESTLLSMMVPMLHYGMVIVGLPYSEAALMQTKTGGTPYGASHFDGANHSALRPIDEDEYALCIALGRRVADFAKKLSV